MLMKRTAVLRWFGGVVLLGACLLLISISYTSHLGAGRAGRSRLLPRHVTKKKVHARYIEHQVDPMRIDLRESYERRRRLLSSAVFRPKFRPRSEALDYHRGPATPAPTETVQQFIPLARDGSGAEFDLRCSTCALVSNSGQLLYSQAGESIDSAQCVFRMNAAPTKGYELDVGQKTTARVVSHSSITGLAANASEVLDPERHLKSILFHGPDYKYSIGSVADAIRGLQLRYPTVHFYRTSPLLEERAGKEFEGHTGSSRQAASASLSTGLYSLMVLKDICDSVTVYGMVPDGYCREHPESTVPYNYFGSNSQNALPECMMYRYHQEADLGQRLETERGIFRTWARDNDINFLHPSW